MEIYNCNVYQNEQFEYMTLFVTESQGYACKIRSTGKPFWSVSNDSVLLDMQIILCDVSVPYPLTNHCVDFRLCKCWYPRVMKYIVTTVFKNVFEVLQAYSACQNTQRSCKDNLWVNFGAHDTDIPLCVLQDRKLYLD